MAANNSAPALQERRLGAYLDWLASALRHKDREEPLRNYCRGLLLDGERKSIEPMAARLAPDHVQRMHESLHHLVAQSPWSDADLLRRVRERVLPAMQRHAPVEAWIVDETGWAKQGSHSVGVAQQYCGRLKRKANAQVSVSLSVATASASLPISWRLYLPEEWARDQARRKAAGIPSTVEFESKPRIALEAIRRAVEEEVPRGVVLADEVYGSSREFREAVEGLNLRYSVAVRRVTTAWTREREPLPPKEWTGKGQRPNRPRRDATHQPLKVEQLALALPARAWRSVSWREGSRGALRSRFAAIRVRPAYGDDRGAGQQREQWLLMEWPETEQVPAGYWLSNLPGGTSLRRLVEITKQRWRIERDYEELKQEVGLSHYEGRNWRGFHHHATLCIAAYGFLVEERSLFSPSAQAGHVGIRAPGIPAGFRRRGAPGPRATA